MTTTNTTTLRNDREHDTLSTMSNTTIPDNLTVSTPIAEELSRRINLGGYDTPITIDARTSFEPRHHVSVDIGTSKQRIDGSDEYRTVVSKVEITVYGTMTYKDRTDSGANVHVVRTSNGVQHWCKSTAWNGRTFQDMPEGARKRVAETVHGLLGKIDWAGLSAETQEADARRSINRHLSEARGHLEDARREQDRLGHPSTRLPLS